MLKLYNTLTRKKEEFIPREEGKVEMYSCGPTVYDYVHIGNLRAFVSEDILYRTLKYKGYDVNYIMNITDVGHLTDDADQGEDKMKKGARREGKTAEEIAKFYTKAFKKDTQDLNILPPDKWSVATKHIQEMIELVKKLQKKGFTYRTSDGIYFDTTKLDDYGKLAQLDKQELEPGARVEMKEKKNKHDFAVWKFSPQDENRQMEWRAFGEKGFPGWHIECSAMSMDYLGTQFDIHWGGVDHIPVHHTNEIAQSEAATGKKPWVKFWLHVEFLQVKDEKMSKSKGNFVTLRDIKDESIDPLAFRYFLLQSHYRKELNFTWKALTAAEKGLKKLRRKTNNLQSNQPGDPKLEEEFIQAINDDLNTSEALSVLWKGFEENRINQELVSKFDKILGLDLLELKEKEVKVPKEVQELLEMRAEAREAENWDRSDKLRAKIRTKGFEVRDTEEGQEITEK